MSTSSRDIEHTHCGLVITEPKHRELLAPIADRLPPTLEIGRRLDAALAGYDDRRPGPRPVGRHDLGAHLHERHVGRTRRR